MSNALKNVRPSLALAILALILGVVKGITFGVTEEGNEQWIAAHHAPVTEIFVYIGVGGLLSGLTILVLHLLFDMWKE